MKRLLIACALVLGLPAGSALAHHSFAAEFDGNRPIRIDGTLSKVDWSNPHTYFYVDVKGEDGKVITWGCEGANPGTLSRRGLSKGEAKIGDHILVDGYAAKDHSPLMDARRIYLNGKVIFGSQADAAEQK
jgi:hypothetical protein